MGKTTPCRNRKKKAAIPSCSIPGLVGEQILVENEVVTFFRLQLKEAFRKIGLRELLGEYAETYCTFSDNPDVILRYSNEIKQSITFQLSLAKNVGEVTSWLENETQVFAKEVLAKNQKNYEYSVAYMERLTDSYMGRYNSMVELFEKTAHLTGAEYDLILADINNHLVYKILGMYDNLNKPGNAAFHWRNRLTLKEYCDTKFAKAMEHRKNLAKAMEAESWISNTIAREKMQQFHEELQQTTLKMQETKLAAAAEPETKIPINQNVSPPHLKVINDIQNAGKNLKVKCKLVLNKCVQEYKDEMRKLLSTKLISSENNGLESDHEMVFTLILGKYDAQFRITNNLFQNEILIDYCLRLKKAMDDHLYEVLDKWEIVRSMTFLKVENFRLKFHLETNNFLWKFTGSDGDVFLEKVKCALEQHVEKVKETFQSTFSCLAEDYQKSCLETLQSLANEFLLQHFVKLSAIASARPPLNPISTRLRPRRPAVRQTEFSNF